jgi:hypothetical protein
MKDSSNASSPRKSPGVLLGLFIWSHERGTLPYDIICALILAFVFFVPRSCFAPRRAVATPGGNPPAVSEKATPAGGQMR